MAVEHWAVFEDFTRDTMEQHRIAGAAVAVAREGKVVYANGFGLRSLEPPLPVTPDTVFGIASVTKSFTALAIMDLAAQGKLAPEDRVTEHLPDFLVPGAAGIMIHHLLSHTTGIPPLRRRQELTRFDEHIQYLATGDYRLLGEPGRYLSYCNDAFLILGAIIERVSGRPYREYMKEIILDRLGMSRSTFHPAELARMDNVTSLYVHDPSDGLSKKQPWPELGNYDVGGGVRCSVLDLVKYGGAYTGVTELVSPGWLLRMRSPVYPTAPGRYYAYALQVTPGYSGVTLVEHGGSQVGVSSHFGFVPEAGITVAVLTNVTRVPADVIWQAAVNTALGLPLEQAPPIPPAVDVGPGELARYQGTYASAEGGGGQVFLEDGMLKVTMEGETFPLIPVGDDTFTYVSRGKIRTLRFYWHEEEGAWMLFSGLRVHRKSGGDAGGGI